MARDKLPSTRRGFTLRLTESQVSAVLGVVLLIFFIDGFVVDAASIELWVLIVVGIFIVIGLVRIADSSPVHRVEWHAIVTSIIGTLLVGASVRWVGLSSAFAAACVGVIAGVLPRVFGGLSAATVAPLYVGAFAGMTSSVVLLGPQWLVVAAVITGCLWSIAREAWIGIGGKMGTIAFAGVGLTALLAAAFGNAELMTPVPQYAPALSLAVLVVSAVSTLLTHWLAYSRNWGPVLGSAAPVAIVLLITYGIRNAVELPHDALAAAWFGASFVGMTAPARLAGRRWMLPTMALLFGLLLLGFQAHLSGLGGDLGATAAAAVIAVIGAAGMSGFRPSCRRRHRALTG